MEWFDDDVDKVDPHTEDYINNYNPNAARDMFGIIILLIVMCIVLQYIP